MPKTIITLEGPVFRRQYLLYVLELIHNDKSFYYIGQTGDRKYTTARPPFRRLMGHLEDIGKSTQNQLYRYIAADILEIAEARSRETFSITTKQLVENFLVGSTVCMHVYKLP